MIAVGWPLDSRKATFIFTNFISYEQAVKTNTLCWNTVNVASRTSCTSVQSAMDLSCPQQVNEHLTDIPSLHNRWNVAYLASETELNYRRGSTRRWHCALLPQLCFSGNSQVWKSVWKVCLRNSGSGSLLHTARSHWTELVLQLHDNAAEPDAI